MFLWIGMGLAILLCVRHLVIVFNQHHYGQVGAMEPELGSYNLVDIKTRLVMAGRYLGL